LLQRSDGIGRTHRLPVVELEAVTQMEGVGQLVVADLPAAHPLRLRTKVAVHAEQGVVDQVAEIAGDLHADELRIDDGEIRMRHDLQGPASLCAAAASGERAARKTAMNRRMEVAGMGHSPTGNAASLPWQTRSSIA
jgi:hypothetical protein